MIKDDDLFIYYTYFDENGGYTSLMKADLEENWPLTMREKGMVCGRTTNDSLDVVYAENLDVFLAFSIEDRMSESSRLVVYESVNGKDTFKKEDTTKKHVDDFAHNMGIAKDVNGHIDTREPILAGYAYGRNWGRWSTRFQYVKVDAY